MNLPVEICQIVYDYSPESSWRSLTETLRIFLDLLNHWKSTAWIIENWRDIIDFWYDVQSGPKRTAILGNEILEYANRIEWGRRYQDSLISFPDGRTFWLIASNRNLVRLLDDGDIDRKDFSKWLQYRFFHLGENRFSYDKYTIPDGLYIEVLEYAHYPDPIMNDSYAKRRQKKKISSLRHSINK